MKDRSAPRALTQSVVEENASAVAESIAEVALDAALDAELLKAATSCVTPEERARFSEKLEGERDLAERCGESALLLLDKLTEISKARLRGFACRRYVQGAIDEVILHRIYLALDSMPIWRLIELAEKYFEGGLGSLDLGTATAWQQLNFLEIYYGDKDKRLHIDVRTGD